MKEITKEKFKEIYFKHGGGKTTGWDLARWNKDFEENESPGMKYLVQDPATPKHNRMMIVTDHGTKEYRMFFMTEEAEDGFFDFPGKS